MKRNEFLKKLREALSEYLDREAINTQIDYYDKYISDEMAKGRSEDEVIAELGDPLLIAKTIKTVNGSSDNITEGTTYNEEKENADTGKGKTYVYNTSGIGCVIIGLIVFIVIMMILRFLGFIIIGTTGAMFGLGPFGIIILLLIFWLLTRSR